MPGSKRLHPGSSEDRKKRRRRNDTSPSDTRSTRSGRLDTQDILPTSSAKNVGLLALPVELIYAIHLYSKNPSFTVLNKRIYNIFKACPTSIKAHYLLARWHEAYCYGFFPATPGNNGNRSLKVDNGPELPSAPSWDLLEGGALPELEWNSKFIPVLPTSEFPYPLSNSFQRSADHYILDYCLRYPLTSLDVLHATEDIVLSRTEFGNIVAATGLWRDTEGNLHAHEITSRSMSSSELSQSVDEEVLTMSPPSHLRITELPKRFFRKLQTPHFKEEDQEMVTQRIQHSKTGSSSCDVQNDREQQLREGEEASQGTAEFGLALRRHLAKFGPGPLPEPSTMMILLAVASNHVPVSTAIPSASTPFNSFEGFPLARAAWAKSTFMVQFLLALGADPTRKGGLSLYIAIRNGWLEGLQLLVERDEGKIAECQMALEKIRTYFASREVSPEEKMSSHFSNHLTTPPIHLVSAQSPSIVTQDYAALDEASSDQSSSKRRRLLDRARLDHKMLKEAVKHNQWAVANWLRSKGVIPDLRTIKLIEIKQGNAQAGKAP